MKTKTQSENTNLANAEVKQVGATMGRMERVVDLPLSALKLDPEIQCREKGVDPKTVERYADRMKAGDLFPELEAVEDGNDNLLADGFQRHAAALLAGFTSFKVRIRPGTRRDAVELAVTINLKHGRQFNPKDNRRAVQQLLKHSPDRSDGAIAEMCYVSQSYVSRIHRQLRTVLSCEGGKARIGRDGRKRKPPQKNTPINESTQQSHVKDEVAPATAGSTHGYVASEQDQPQTQSATVSGSAASVEHRLLSFVERELLALSPGQAVSSLAKPLLHLSMACNMIGNRQAGPGELAWLFESLATMRSPSPAHPGSAEAASGRSP